MLNLRKTGVRQTPWACGHKGAIWYANVHADVFQEETIENAKKIVDKALPQKLSTFFGGHYYSFITREYLFNLLLFHFEEHGSFPVGSICIVERWVWDGMLFRSHGKWLKSWAWRFGFKRDEVKAPGYWVRIPSLESMLEQ